MHQSWINQITWGEDASIVCSWHSHMHEEEFGSRTSGRRETRVGVLSTHTHAKEGPESSERPRLRYECSVVSWYRFAEARAGVCWGRGGNSREVDWGAVGVPLRRGLRKRPQFKKCCRHLQSLGALIKHDSEPCALIGPSRRWKKRTHRRDSYCLRSRGTRGILNTHGRVGRRDGYGGRSWRMLHRTGHHLGIAKCSIAYSRR